MTKKIIGIFLIIIGLLALVTPFTPGSWLVFIGLNFLGIRMLFWDKIKPRFLAKGVTPAKVLDGKQDSVSGGQKHDSRQTK